MGISAEFDATRIIAEHWVCIELILILAICYTPWGNVIFGTAPIALDAWLFMLPFAAMMLALEEARKMLVRRE